MANTSKPIGQTRLPISVILLIRALLIVSNDDGNSFGISPFFMAILFLNLILFGYNTSIIKVLVLITIMSS